MAKLSDEKDVVVTLTAEEVRRGIDETRERKLKAWQERCREKLEREEKRRKEMERLVALYQTELLEKLEEAKRDMMACGRYYANLTTETKSITSIQADLFRYGYREKGFMVPWTRRQPMYWTNPFVQVQAKMYQQGFYLLDCSDHWNPAKHRYYFSIGSPTWYNTDPVKWHGLNKINVT